MKQMDGRTQTHWPVIGLMAAALGCGPPAAQDRDELRELESKLAASNITRAWVDHPAGSCYSQDFGSVYRQPGWDRYLLTYGAVTDRLGIHSCTNPGYSEDIWVTWSTTNGLSFGQPIGGTWPPIKIYSSQEFRAQIGSAGAAGCGAACTGWMIGDPALVRGPSSGVWYLYFDAQSCANASSGTWTGIFVATASSWTGPFVLRGKVDDLPGLVGARPLAFPRIFHDPSTNTVYLYYFDSSVRIRAAALSDNGSGLALTQLNGGNPVVAGGTADTLAVFKSGSSYYAVSDRFAASAGQMDRVYAFGPSPSPWSFGAPTTLLTKSGQYSHHIMGVSALSGASTTDGVSRIYFWGAGGDGNSCHSDGWTSAFGGYFYP